MLKVSSLLRKGYRTFCSVPPSPMNLRKITSIALAHAIACSAAFSATTEVEEVNLGSEVNRTDAYVLETVPAEYPSEMLQRGIQGKTLLVLRVDEAGKVGEVKVLASSNEVFREAAIKSVKQWYFQPATVDGVAVPQIIVVPVVFEIEDSKSPTFAQR